MTTARWRERILSFMTTGIGMRTTRKSLTTLMTLADMMWARSLMQSCGLNESVHCAETGLWRAYVSSCFVESDVVHNLLALEDHNKCVRDVPGDNVGDTENNDIANSFTSVTHNLLCE